MRDTGEDPTDRRQGSPIGVHLRFRAQATLDQHITGYNRANENIYTALVLLTEALALLLTLKHEDEAGISGNGRKVV